MGDYNIFLVPSFCFFSLFLTLTLGLQIGQLHYQSAGPQIFKTNWIAHPIPITITAGTITKLAIQHNNWKCGMPGPAGLPGGPADLWRHVKPANSTANYWCTVEWSCLSPKYHFQFMARNTGPYWDRQKQQRSETQECGHASFLFLLLSHSFVFHLSVSMSFILFPDDEHQGVDQVNQSEKVTFNCSVLAYLLQGFYIGNSLFWRL